MLQNVISIFKEFIIYMPYILLYTVQFNSNPPGKSKSFKIDFKNYNKENNIKWTNCYKDDNAKIYIN